MSGPDATFLPPDPWKSFSSTTPPLRQAFVIHPTRRRYWLHILLFLGTVFTTLVVGARLEHNFAGGLPSFSFDQGFFPLSWILAQPSRLLLGIPFSATLMLILLAHEMGHFIACLRYRVYATLPFFIPATTLIGTLGAFIRIKSPIPTRRALFDIGIAGPIAGFVLAVPALALGMALSKVSPLLVHASDLALGYPAIFHLLFRTLPLHNLRAGSAGIEDIYFHPVAVAAWVGMFATALNLIPASQLDGGHIIYALWPRYHRAISRITVVALILMSPFLWMGWIFWAGALILFGRHPAIPPQPGLGAGRRWIALAAIAMFVLTFMPAPFPGAALDWREALHWLQHP